MIPTSVRQCYHALRPLIDELYTLVSGSKKLTLETEYAFVFRPGIAPNGPNVFATWPTLDAAVNAVQGPKLVEIDVTHAPAVVPAGTWNLNDWTLIGVPQSLALGQPLLTFAAGAVIDPVATLTLTLTQSIGIQSAAPGATIWTPANPGGLSPTLYLRDLSFLSPNAVAPLIHVGAGILFIVDADGGGLGDTANTVIQVDAGGTLAMNASDGGGPTAHAVAGAGTWNLAVTPGGFFQQPQGLTPTITYINPPQNVEEKNAGGLGPSPIISFTTAGTITRSSSGKVRASACITATASVGTAPGTAVTVTLFRNPGALAIATQTAETGSGLGVQCTVSWIDTLPDQLPHAYGVSANIGGAGPTLSAVAGNFIVTADELT